MKKLLLSLCLLISVVTLIAQRPDDVAKFNKEVIDFGKVKFETPPSATFIVKNIGKTPLIIEKAEPTCGCTIGDYTKAPIAPGKEGWIKAQFNAKALGAFDKHVNVKFAGISETKTITIKGEVISVADFAKLKKGGSSVKTKYKTR
ncbi:MAG: DUF1573 domain-containing protein [Ferruginibacter sp.]